MQTGCHSSSQFLTVGDEGLEVFNMSILGDISDYQWKEFQGAKLASLFGLDRESSQGNESFQYTAPKQPRKSSNPAPSNQKPVPQAGAPAVLFATAVQAFRYINEQYVKQGKLGAAVLGSHTTKEYKLLLYLSQQKQVAAAKIHVGFVFTVQPNNYCSFYDDQRQNWSLMFESDKTAVDFCKEICLAKANSSSSLDTVVVQDLSLGEGQGVENGDSLEVVYTGWLLQNHTIGQMFDSNQNKDKLLRLKIGAGKVIKGWEEGMLGMQKEGSRLIVIPPNLAYGSKGVPNRVPSDSTLIFEAELRRVKFSKDSGSDRTSASSRDSAAPSPAPSTAPSVQNATPEPPVQAAASGPGRPGEPLLRAKSNSLSEQLANPDATKAKLISRMAKMGQPMLPFMTEVAGHPESSDSELEDTSGSRAKDQAAASSPVQITSAAPASAYVMTTVGTQPGLPGSSHAFQPYSYTQTSATPSQLQPVGQVYPAQTVPYMGTGDVTSFLMTEARQHNTEIRLSVGKVADKVDQLASKIDDLQRQGSLSMGVPSMSMETSMIMHNIQRIVQENECLKKEVFEKSARIEEQNHKIGDLINQNQRYIEQSHQLLEQRNDSLKSSSDQNQARLLQAEQEKHALPVDLGSGQVRLTEDLALSASRVSQLQLDASAHQQKSVELQNKLGSALQDSERHCQHIASLETQLDELKEVAERAQTQYRSEKQRCKEMELKVNTMEEELQDVKADKESLERALSERKKKWQAERRRRDEEVEELRKNSQQELDNFRAQLRKARSSSDNAVSEQLSQLQLELDEEWKRKCDHMLASAKEQHRGELAELTEQRDDLQDKLAQLQEKLTALKQSRDSEEQSLQQHCNQSEELQALQEKYASLEQQGAAVREKLESRVAQLERQVEEQDQSEDTAAEVKRVMNGVYHSLRGEFDLSESYSGQAVLGVIVSTIKNVTLQLLSGTDKSALKPHKKEEEAEEKEEESEAVKQSEEKPLQNVHVNGKKEAKQEENEDGENVADSGSLRVGEIQVDQSAATEKEAETVTESKTQSQAEASQATDLHSVSTTALQPQETAAAAESEVQHEQGQPSATETYEGNESTHPDDGPDTSLPPEDGQEAVSDSKAAVSTEVDPERAPVDEPNDAPQKAFGPPANPPPPPNMLQNNSGEDTSLTGGIGEENGEEPFFQSITRAKPPAAPSEEEEEDEMSLKGHPPPAPLFGDDEDEDDLDWLN
ncbi:FK506-binding protein 15 isoform X4 [Amphiprion ocellaris]|uniref:FK506-binding protein 15 isoform X4 n=1 Tax=Amphiprion ocellaris TaxID=80972 RepID=UPI0024113DEC|nr:FK506-binding protein 15 isoform X4 [Amphiprion ocellaris]